MTSEVCMMNRLAVVLAADSATTVSRWNNGAREERYFKGANKIFQLSNRHPIGLMIFDSADLLRVPWEIIIKSFRHQLGHKSFNTVSGYADEFMQYLNGNVDLFSEEVQEETITSAANSIALALVAGAVEKVQPENLKQAVVERLHSELLRLEAKPLPEALTIDFSNKVIADFMGRLKDEKLKWASSFGLDDADLALLARYSLLLVLKSPRSSLTTTGLVFAGYGDHQIFPEMVEYESQGIIAGTHVFQKMDQQIIDHENPTSISAFAQTSMIETFQLGLSEDIYGSMMVATENELSGLIDEVLNLAGSQPLPGDRKSELLKVTAEKISVAVLEKSRDEHSLPLRNVIGFLPVDELAGLAETLITLQSLKEKVTKPSETVGGPVDVAVITKHEGLVWIKRKHFFDSELNSRFRLRQAAELA